jgi:hypothetical protein
MTRSVFITGWQNNVAQDNPISHAHALHAGPTVTKGDYKTH